MALSGEKTWPNPVATMNAPNAFGFHAERRWRRVTDQRRSYSHLISLLQRVFASDPMTQSKTLPE
jgi:hypothetical protein